MTDLERAMADVAFIQQRLAASTRFDALTPQAVGATGLLSLVAATAQGSWPEALGNDPVRYVAFWTAVAILAVALIGSEALARARRLHGSMADVLIVSTLRLLLPFGAVGAALALVLLRAAPDAAWLLPGLWQLLIALAGASAASTLPRAIIWPAGWYFISAVSVLIIAAGSRTLDPWLMGIPFGIGQIAVALVLHRAARSDA